MRRGSHAEIDIFPGKPLDNPLAGNVVDICPVGALLDKDFLHRQRAWFLSKHSSICTHCSTGCNITAEENRGALWRFKPRHNPQVNDYWICDEGRYGYKAANDPNLLRAMYVRTNNDLQPVAIDEALKTVDRGMREIAQRGAIIAGVLSPFLTVEEAYLLARYLKERSPSNVLALGPVPTRGIDRTFQPDLTKGRTGDTSFVLPRTFTIRAEKCPNYRGVAAIIEHFQGTVAGFDELLRRATAGEFEGLYVASDAIEPWIDAPQSESLRSKVKFLVVQDTTVTPLAHQADVVLAGATFGEKAGSYVNADRRLQYSEAALPPRAGSLPDLDILAILLDRTGGPVNSHDILAELADQVPAFAAAKGGKIPTHGIVLGQGPPPPEPLGATPSFTDTWFLKHGAARGR
jgi:NADH-quinone oxidoreductase subunit G